MTTSTIKFGNGVTAIQSALGVLGVQVDPVVKRASRRKTKAIAKSVTRRDRHAARRQDWQSIDAVLELL